MPKRNENPCEATTRDGKTCRVSAMPGGGGRCHLHTSRPLTDARWKAARENALQHGWFATGVRDEKRRARLEEILAGLGNRGDEVQRRLVAHALLRAEGVAEWEANREEPSPLGAPALAAASKAVASLPEEAASEDHRIDEAEILRHVEALMEREPELFIRRYPPPVQDAIRRAIREGGEPIGGAE